MLLKCLANFMNEQSFFFTSFSNNYSDVLYELVQFKFPVCTRILEMRKSTPAANAVYIANLFTVYQSVAIFFLIFHNRLRMISIIFNMMQLSFVCSLYSLISIVFHILQECYQYEFENLEEEFKEVHEKYVQDLSKEKLTMSEFIICLINNMLI